jgi:hypothetical protein
MGPHTQKDALTNRHSRDEPIITNKRIQSKSHQLPLGQQDQTNASLLQLDNTIVDNGQDNPE